MERHFRIVGLRIIPFLLQLIIGGSSKRRSKILILRIKQRGFSVPTARFIRSLKIRRPSNPAFAYKLVPFITYYTQVSRDALQNRRTAYNSILFATDYTRILEKAQQNLDFAYKAEGLLHPYSAFYTQFEDSPPSNPAFAYKLVPFITYYTQVSRDALQNRRTAYNSIPFATDCTRILEKAQQNLDFAYKAEGLLRPHSAFYTQFEDSPPLKSCICV